MIFRIFVCFLCRTYKFIPNDSEIVPELWQKKPLRNNVVIRFVSNLNGKLSRAIYYGPEFWKLESKFNYDGKNASLLVNNDAIGHI